MTWKNGPVAGSNIIIWACFVASPLTLCCYFMYVQVLNGLNISDESTSHASTAVACFLVQEGADIYIQNKKDHATLQVCSPEVATIITSFIGKPRYTYSYLCNGGRGWGQGHDFKFFYLNATQSTEVSRQSTHTSSVYDANSSSSSRKSSLQPNFYACRRKGNVN